METAPTPLALLALTVECTSRCATRGCGHARPAIEHLLLLLLGLTGASIDHPAAPRLPFAHDAGQHAPK
jgi:hypothetical protein